VRKTAGQCQRVKQTLANLGVEFLERDISMAVAYKEELKKRLGLEEGKPAPVPVPYLFIDGESVGGGDDLDDMVGLYNSNAVVTHSLKPPGFTHP
jgi:glutaredoxin